MHFLSIKRLQKFRCGKDYPLFIDMMRSLPRGCGDYNGRHFTTYLILTHSVPL